MARLGLAMIVRNEADCLGACLESVRGVFDEIVVVDTGSTDRTKEIASSYGARVLDFTWIDDFAAARNFAFDSANSEWVMWLDADDVLLPESRERLLALKSRLGDADAYLMRYDYAQDGNGRTICHFFRHRILRNTKEARWKYPIHECIQTPKTWKEAMTNIVVTHRRTPEASARDNGRNLRILRKAIEQYPDDQRMRFYFSKELFNDGFIEESVGSFEKYLLGGDWHENVVNAHLLLALAHWKLGQEEKAIDVSMRGIRLDPRWAEFYVTIGQIYYNRSDWPKAISWFELAATRKIPESWGTVLLDNYEWVPWDRLCKCYGETGRLREAYEANEKALAFRPSDPRLLFNREYLSDRIFPGRVAERPVRLSLGGGSKPIPSYRNCDLYEGPRVEERFDQGHVPYPDASVRAIYSEHALEHSASHDAARATIREWARVLRHGGELVLKVPDLDLCCEAFLREEDRAKGPDERWTPKEWFRYTIYGIQRSQGAEPPDGQYHRTGFTKAELQRLLQENGFRIEEIRNYDACGTPAIDLTARQVAQKIKARWLVVGINEDDPSCRIRRVNVHRWLQWKGIDSKMLVRAAYPSEDALFAELRKADVVIVTYWNAEAKRLIERLRRSGVAVAADHNEDVPGQPWRDECLQSANRIVTCSTELSKLRSDLGRTVTIPDSYELPTDPVNYGYEPHGKDGKVRVVWCGMGGNAQNLDPLRPIIQELGMELVVISEWDCADKRWNAKTWLHDMSEADIAICPQREWLQPAKSNTKATQAMALGLPVVASPLRAYREAIEHGRTGFICENFEDWKKYLMLLRDDASLRERMGRAARVEVRKKYFIDAIGEQWLALLDETCRENCSPPKVDIIIPTWNNLSYLKLCVESIRRNTDHPYNIVVVNSGTDDTGRWLQEQPDIIYYNSPVRLHFSAANNAGLRIAKERYVCFLNDDTIVSKGWLSALMHEAMKPGVGAVGPFSNCDKGWLHDETILIEGQELRAGMGIGDVERIVPAIESYRHEKVVTDREWIAFYCTLAPRDVIDRVGILDEKFRSGDEDLDYCRRIKKLGYRIVQSYDSWVFHFGGKTRKKSEDTNHEQHHAEDRANHAYFNEKWKKPIFALYTGPAWERWSPDSIDKGGIGGSETCAVHVARAFAARGYRAFVFSDIGGEEGVYDDVVYSDYRKFPAFAEQNYIDIFVTSRQTDVFSLPIRAGYKICWVHDIWLSSDPSYDVKRDLVDKYYVLSPWHRDFFVQHHRIAPDQVVVTRDGVDLSRFNDAPARERGRMIYSSSPDRGLDVLLELFPKIRKEVPEATLHVYYGFKNWEAAIERRNDPRQVEWMRRIKAALCQPGVTFHDRIGQRELAQEIMRSDLWCFPTFFTETFCITAAEMMAGGVPIVTSDLAALSTTVGDAGILIPGDSRSDRYQSLFLEESVRMLKDRKRWEEYSARGKAKVQTYRWNTIADEWIAAIRADTAERKGMKMEVTR